MEDKERMSILKRQQFVNALEEDWAGYPTRFHAMEPEARSAFLGKQGYARFADLLAHIIAWWELGYPMIEKYLSDLQSELPQIDVDLFNARAVESVRNLDEAEVEKSFERVRYFLINFIKTLPDSAFENEKVITQFNMDIVGHLQEHRIN